MDLPSFLWLWKTAAWSMGFSLTAYILLAITGIWMLRKRRVNQTRPFWLRPLHLMIGGLLVTLTLLLLGIGIVGTLGRYGSLGHSLHLPAGLVVVGLVLFSAVTALQIDRYPWARSLHVTANVILGAGFVSVLFTGWTVVQKYLP
ncbi:DUF4079 domain-containing protein [Spirulina sp. CS-785/01]|uniref:DUF4079 domain-containing protein n=1 Tax=Spirulina sp. CS-785/01 TaxID=3021716 RepID=UPI00232C11B0|nr:DUF4079 domain-containing protein [Spirulina sp. CS-785/01]MDB9313073.1 DUF4079 domain-containing protein [Spirulina sp. CS-785/01]